MKTVGVRTLQQNASKVLRSVATGELVEVTERGRRVAWLVPAARGRPLDLLEAAGRLARAESDLLDLGKPILIRKGAEAP